VTTVRNLTPHPVTVVVGDRNAVIPPDGVVARAAVTETDAGTVTIAGLVVPVVVETLGPPVDLPDPEPGVYLIVSRVAASAAAAHGRTTTDLLSPTRLVRDGDGRVVGCAAFTV
jgi:hypothetical protein